MAKNAQHLTTKTSVTTYLNNLTGISIERLRSFCEIVEAGSVVGAASKNRVEQSQYSRQMRDLEKALGTKLFVKEGKFLRLSRDGGKLAALTRAYFGGLNDLAERVSDGGRVVRMGTAESIMRWVLIPRYAELVTAVGARIDVESNRTERIVEKVLNGGLDLGIVRADAVTPELESFEFPALAYSLLIPRAILPDKSAAGLRAVRTLPLVLIDGDGRFVRGVRALLEKNEITAQVIARVESFSLAAELAKAISAATIVPRQATGEFAADQFAIAEIEVLAALTRPLSVIVSKQTAELSTHAWRAASRMSRLFCG